VFVLIDAIMRLRDRNNGAFEAESKTVRSRRTRRERCSRCFRAREQDARARRAGSLSNLSVERIDRELTGKPRATLLDRLRYDCAIIEIWDRSGYPYRRNIRSASRSPTVLATDTSSPVVARESSRVVKLIPSARAHQRRLLAEFFNAIETLAIKMSTSHRRTLAKIDSETHFANIARRYMPARVMALQQTRFNVHFFPSLYSFSLSTSLFLPSPWMEKFYHFSTAYDRVRANEQLAPLTSGRIEHPDARRKTQDARRKTQRTTSGNTRVSAYPPTKKLVRQETRSKRVETLGREGGEKLKPSSASPLGSAHNVLRVVH